MAIVYLATLQGPNQFKKLQVIKRLRPALAADATFLEMFLDEAKLAAQINHPNVVQTNEIGFDGEHYFIAMEFLDGQSLETLLRAAADAGKPIPLAFHVQILVDALAGLHAAHEQRGFDGKHLNVVHRDMSPHNLMVTYDGRVKVLDFGIAKAAGSSEDTRSGILRGKAAYMSPEQFGKGAVDRRADVFAVGVMLWQAITRRRLWSSDLSDIEIFQKLSAQEIPTPSSAGATVAPELEAICMRALALSPDKRYATAREFHDALEAWLAKSRDPHSARDIGAFVSELFAENRRKMARTLEDHHKLGDNAPVVEPTARTSVKPGVPVLWGDNAEHPPDHSPTKQSFVTNGAANAVARRRNVALAAAGAALVVVSVIVLATGSRSAHDPRATQGTPTSSTPVTNATPAQQQTRVEITASPGDAHVFLDDHEIEGNPAKGSFPRDGASHVLRVQADGYKPRRELVTYDQDSVVMNVALEALPRSGVSSATGGGGGGRHSAVAPTAAPPPQPSAPPSTPAAPATAPTHPPEPGSPRQLDTKDPWRH